MAYRLFSQVVLTEDLPEYELKKGAIATTVEHYPVDNGEDGYSLEGFDFPYVTIEVSESKITAVPQPKRVAIVASKLSHLSTHRLQQIQILRRLSSSKGSDRKHRISTKAAGWHPPQGF